MKQTIIKTIEELEKFVSDNTGAVIYFSAEHCSVCKVLKPKLLEYLEENYPQMTFAYVNTVESKEIAAQKSIFTIPTILFFFEGKEFIRKSRNVNFSELDSELSRIYEILFR